MRTMKKVFSIILAVCMTLALWVPAMAADTTTITAPSNSHTYEVYQIFTGDLANGVLSNVKWGKNGTSTEGEAVSQTILNELAGVNSSSESEKLAVIEKYVNLNGTSMGTITNGASMNVTTGYYLIKDNGPASEGETYSEYVVAVVGPTTISPKTGTTSSEKKVKDTNDSTANSTTDWQDSADYDIGDNVPFQLKATIASDYARYTTYKLTFHDEESAGLTFNSDSVVVKVDGTTIDASNYSVVTSGLTDGCTFEVQFTNLKTITSVKAGSVITVEYTAQLNSNAVIGSTGNPNESHITYSNNPNGNQEGTTPDDKVTVFTYKVIVNKVDQNKNALAGAGFTLYKKNASGEYEAIGTEVKGTNLTTFEWKGLDDGDYKLVETTTPAGYNTAADVEFTITANHEVTSDDPALTSLSAGDAFTGTASTGTLTTEVVNNAGSTLPSTGGIGTTVFYVVGGVLAVGALVLLVVKKRMSGCRE